jgi:hypothetical protein
VTYADIHDELKRIMVMLAPDDLSSDFPDPKRAAEAKKAIVGLSRKVDHRIAVGPESMVGYYPDRAEAMDEAGRLFESYWQPIVCGEDGSLDVEKVKKELYDYRELRDEADRVYEYITGCSAPWKQGDRWAANVAKVLDAAYRHRQALIDAAVKRALEGR